MHRRLGAKLPDGLIGEFVFWAENALDEFRCDRAVHERGLAAQTPELDEKPSGLADISEAFEQVRRNYWSSGEIEPAFHGAFQALKRLTVWLAYGAAQLVADSDGLEAWSAVPAMEQMLRIARPVTLDTDDARLGEIVMELAAASRQWLRESGFDCSWRNGGRYLEILR